MPKLKQITDFILWLLFPSKIKVKLNAHAMGAYKGKTYTNSLEAFENSYNNGFRNFETDLAITRDNYFVLSHEVDKIAALSLDEFTSLYFEENKLHAIALNKMFEMMKKYPDIFVMFDFLPAYYDREDTEKCLCLYNQFSDEDVKNRSVIEVYSVKQVLALKEAGCENIMFFVDTDYKNMGFETIDEYFDFLLQNNIKYLSVSADALKEYDISRLKDNGITIYSPGYNNLIQAKWAQDHQADIITTDLLSPKILKSPLFPFIKFMVVKIIIKIFKAIKNLLVKIIGADKS